MTSPVHFDREGVRFISLCAGIEAASMAWCPLGWTCVAVAEIEPFPCAVLKHHYPDVPNLGDVNLITREQIEALGHIDVVIFGFPCQDLSGAGKRKGLKNADGTHTRSGLFFKCFEVAMWTKARWVVVENVPGLFSSHEGRDFAAVLGELAGASFDVPRDGWENSGFALGQNGLVEWAVLDAQYMHLAQRRERVFFVLNTGNWADRPPLLSDATSLSGHIAPSRKAGKGITHDLAPCIGASGRGFDRCGDTRGRDAVVAHTLKGEGFDASEDGTGRGVPLTTCPITGNPYGDHESREDLLVLEVADCLQERDSKGSEWPKEIADTLNAHFGDKQGLEDQHIDGGAGMFVLSSGQANAAISKDVAHSLDCLHEAQILASPVAFPAHMSSTQHASAEDLSPAIGAENPMAVAFERRMVRTTGGQPQEELNHALRADTNSGDAAPCVAYMMAVRRLTPTECERLQGFPDGFTKIPWRGKPADKCPDGPRYKALGNSMAVPVIRWIGRQIQQAEMWEGVDSGALSEGLNPLALVTSANK